MNAVSQLNTRSNRYLFDDRLVNGEVPDGCVTCAVVGNGGILNGTGMGREIDAHDYVFRYVFRPQDETWTDFDAPSWIQYDLFRKNKLPGSKNLNLAKFMIRAVCRGVWGSGLGATLE